MNRKEANKIIEKHSAAFGALPREAIEAIEYLINAEPCEDAVNRAELSKALGDLPHEYKTTEQRARTGGIAACQAIVRELSSVTPKQKIGHWINYQKNRWIYAQCSECGTVHDTQTNYCPNCGAKMEESENG